MFAESILETSWAHRSRRSWTTLTSFGLQAGVVAILIAIPLIRPVAFPFLRPLGTPPMLTVPAGRPPQPPRHSALPRNDSNLQNGRIIMPPSIPTHVRIVQEEIALPQVADVGQYISGSTGPAGSRWVPFAFGNPANTLPVPPPPPTVTHTTVRISHMSEGDLVHKVQPAYPQLAKLAHVQGVVVLAAVISREGTIEKLRVVNGHPMLVQAAVDAVQQWRYKPYILNGDPVEVETQITVNFSLTGS